MAFSLNNLHLMIKSWTAGRAAEGRGEIRWCWITVPLPLARLRCPTQSHQPRGARRGSERAAGAGLGAEAAPCFHRPSSSLPVYLASWASD